MLARQSVRIDLGVAESDLVDVPDRVQEVQALILRELGRPGGTP